jgi:hypothetical protein
MKKQKFTCCSCTQYFRDAKPYNIPSYFEITKKIIQNNQDIKKMRNKSNLICENCFRIGHEPKLEIFTLNTFITPLYTPFVSFKPYFTPPSSKIYVQEFRIHKSSDKTKRKLFDTNFNDFFEEKKLITTNTNIIGLLQLACSSCITCGLPLTLFMKQWKNTTYCLFFICSNNHFFKWNSSIQYFDESNQIDKEIFFGYIFGRIGSFNHIENVFNIINLSHFSSSTFHTYVLQLSQLVNNFLNFQFDMIINLLNQEFQKSNKSTEISFDIQWCTPQKKGKRATKASTIVIGKYKGKFSIIRISHENNGNLKFNFKDFGEHFIWWEDNKPIKCLEKLSTIKILNLISFKLLSIVSVCGDGCNSSLLRMKNNVQSHHPNVKISVDIFHISSDIPSA